MPTISSTTVSNTALLKGVSSNPGAGGATQVPPGIIALPSGTVLKGEIAQLDGRGNAVLSTAKGNVSLQTEIPIKLGNEIALRLTTSAEGLRARILSVDGLSPKEFTAKATNPRGQDIKVNDIVQTAKSNSAAATKGDAAAASQRAGTPAAATTTAAAEVATRPLSKGLTLNAVLLSRAPELPQILSQLPSSINVPNARLDAGATITVRLTPNSIQFPANTAQTAATKTTPATSSPVPTTTQATANTAANPAGQTATATTPAASTTTATQTAPATTTGTTAAPTASTTTATANATPAATTTPSATATTQAATNTATATTGNTATPNTSAAPTNTSTTANAPTNTAAGTQTPASATTAATTTSGAAATASTTTAATTTTTNAATATNTTATANATSATSANAPAAATPNTAIATVTTSAAPTLTTTAAQLAQGTLPAQVIGHEQSGQTVVKTALGNFKISIPTPGGSTANLPIGTQFSLQIQSIQVPMTTGQIAAQISTAAAPLSELSMQWNNLQEAMHIIAQTQPAIAAQILENIIPKPGPRMATAMLFFISALRGGDVRQWLGDEATKILEQANRGDLIRKLTTEFGTLRQFFFDSPSPNWQAAFVPVHDGQQWQQAGLFLKKDPPDSGSDEAKGTRFIMEVSLSKLGMMQFDGFIRKHEASTHFDLIIRSQNTLSDADRQNIRDIYQGSAELTGLKGGISFQISNPFPILPMKEILSDAPDVMA